MANATLHIDVVSAEESIFSGEAEFVVLPGEAGELGIYPRHAPLITRIKPGAVRITPAGGGEEQLIFVAGAKATEALKKAQEAMAKTQDKAEIATLQGEFAMMAAQLAAIRRLRKK